VNALLRLSVPAARHFLHDIAYEGFGIAEEHQGLVKIVEPIVDAGEARA